MSDGLLVKPLKEFAPDTVEFVWEPYLPSSTLCLIEGPPGSAKTFLAIRIAAAATTGLSICSLSGVPSLDPANVLWMTYEDDWSRSIRPRFDAAGGDASRLLAVTGVGSPSRPSEFTWSQRDELLATLDGLGSNPIIVADPINGFLPHGTSELSSAQLREVMQPVMTLLQERRATLIGIRHHRKGNHGNAAEAGAGALGGWSALARSIVGIFPDPDGVADDRVMAHVKHNLTLPGKSLKFRIEKNAVRWTGISERDADGLHASSRIPCVAPKEREALTFLREYLRAGARPARDVEAAANAAGISTRTLNRAKKSLGVKSVPSRSAESAGKVGEWLWRLPS